MYGQGSYSSYGPTDVWYSNVGNAAFNGDGRWQQQYLQWPAQQQQQHHPNHHQQYYQQPLQQYQQPTWQQSSSRLQSTQGSSAQQRQQQQTPDAAANRANKRPKHEQQQGNAGLSEQSRPGPGANPSVPWLDVLRDDMLTFAQQAQPTAQEQQERDNALRAFEGVVQSAVGSAVGNRSVQACLFGSAAAGLQLHSSDLDIAITGLCAPYEGKFDDISKMEVNRYLRKVEQKAKVCMALKRTFHIKSARIPVLKLTLRNGVELDVSVNDNSGMNAARFLKTWVQEYPVVHLLVLVLKALLKSNGLGDVASGGLGSWSLSNMVIGHIMVESDAGAEVDHPGRMLYSFLKRYGHDWDLAKDAVAVAQGGIVSMASLSQGRPFVGPGKMAIKDPLSGRDTAGGSHRYADVQRLWRDTYNQLTKSGPVAAARLHRYGPLGVLSVALDCHAVLQRNPGQSTGQHDSSRAAAGGYGGRYSGSAGAGGNGEQGAATAGKKRFR